VGNQPPAPTPGTPAPAGPPANEPPKPVVPDTYDLKAPANSSLDATAISRIATTAKALGLTAEAAGKLVQHDHEQITAYESSLSQEWETQKTEWLGTIKADAEIGGASFVENMELAKRAAERFGGKEFREALESTGYGNHPLLVRAFVRIGKAMADDKFVMGATGAGAGKSLEEKFYDHPTSKVGT
jgi:hypothetical protein